MMMFRVILLLVFVIVDSHSRGTHHRTRHSERYDEPNDNYDDLIERLNESEDYVDEIVNELDEDGDNMSTDDVESNTYSNHPKAAFDENERIAERHRASSNRIRNDAHSNSDFKRDTDNTNLVKRSIVYETKTNLTCSPVDRAYEIPFDEPGYVISPRFITVKRCEGACITNHTDTTKRSCVALNQTTVNSYVHKIGTNTVTPHAISYVNHTACGCVCRIQQSDCHGYTILSENTCTCNCPGQKNVTCSEIPEKTWSKIYCDCRCKNVVQCNAGEVWNSDTCKCGKILSTCPANTFLDSTDCSCTS